MNKELKKLTEPVCTNLIQGLDNKTDCRFMFNFHYHDQEKFYIIDNSYGRVEYLRAIDVIDHNAILLWRNNLSLFIENNNFVCNKTQINSLIMIIHGLWKKSNHYLQDNEFLDIFVNLDSIGFEYLDRQIESYKKLVI